MGHNSGESDEQPVHTVDIGSFYLSKYEVTVEEFEQFIEATNYETDADKDGESIIWIDNHLEKKSGINWKYDADGRPRSGFEYTHPVIHVSWNDAVAYCQWLSQKTGLTYRLPTEAEWKYAAKGVKNSSYSYAGALTIDEVAWYVSNSGSRTHPVGQKKATELGLHDIIGNVQEWCQDWNKSNYDRSRSSLSINIDFLRACCGGSWVSSSISLSSTFRTVTKANRCGSDIGFRIAREL